MAPCLAWDEACGRRRAWLAPAVPSLRKIRQGGIDRLRAAARSIAESLDRSRLPQIVGRRSAGQLSCAQVSADVGPDLPTQEQGSLTPGPAQKQGVRACHSPFASQTDPSSLSRIAAGHGEWAAACSSVGQQYTIHVVTVRSTSLACDLCLCGGCWGVEV